MDSNYIMGSYNLHNLMNKVSTVLRDIKNVSRLVKLAFVDVTICKFNSGHRMTLLRKYASLLEDIAEYDTESADFLSRKILGIFAEDESGLFEDILGEAEKWPANPSAFVTYDVMFGNKEFLNLIKRISVFVLPAA